MESRIRIFETIKTKHVVYITLIAAAISWPWIWMVATGSMGEGDLVDLISLGMLPAIIISAFIMYKETVSHPGHYRWAFAIMLATSFLLVWIIPAVGIFGRSGDPADLPFYGVLTVGIIGALISRLQPRGMAITLYAMAIAQLLVSVYGLISGLGSMIILNGFISLLWVGSAMLFRHASKKEHKPNYS